MPGNCSSKALRMPRRDRFHLLQCEEDGSPSEVSKVGGIDARGK